MMPSSDKLTIHEMTQLGVLLAAAIALRLAETSLAWLLPLPGAHLGLANIANRLRLIYGGRASIRVYTDAARQTVVQMDIPQGEE